MSDPVDPKPDYWAGQIGYILIAIILFIVLKGVLSCGSM